MLSDERIDRLVGETIDAWRKNEWAARDNIASIWYPELATPIAKTIRVAISETIAEEREACVKVAKDYVKRLSKTIDEGEALAIRWAVASIVADICARGESREEP